MEALCVQSPVSRLMTCVCPLHCAVNDSVCKRHMIAPDWRRPWGRLCPKLLGQMKDWFIWWGQWVSCSCCRPVMVTIQELIASTGLPPVNRQRLWRVMQQYGYADVNAVVVGVRWLTPERLEAAASPAELKPPLTMMEVGALLDAAGKHVMLDRKMSWTSMLRKAQTHQGRAAVP